MMMKSCSSSSIVSCWLRNSTSTKCNQGQQSSLINPVRWLQMQSSSTHLSNNGGGSSIAQLQELIPEQQVLGGMRGRTGSL
ncbi:PREDICTED: citrate synthase 4, mitochondrial-like [Camelina sativa]|uniref:Citrate synthase 4, mitochondrial-like n=1 Tax=Camelina sativa TaxID=90675 RepID=A0ABM1RNP2_CAMSA|nr:PREDICTED: citrate synthase 4, mitochondrial-like [Camelina sativa]